MFLFDKERTGRLPYLVGERSMPEMVWQTTLRQSPPKAPESTAIFDSDGNIYFGCHDNCIYSLTSAGDIRWQFVTSDKVYSSPLLFDNKLYFCCNRAEVICLDLNGKLVWSYDAFKELRHRGRFERTLANIQSYFRYDYEFGSYMKINAWCSPNLLSSGSIVVNLYGVGVLALNSQTGIPEWKTDLGIPYFHLAGTAITEHIGNEFIVAVSQSNGIFRINSSGLVQWKKGLVSGANSWGNPSIDKEEKAIYCTTSKKNEAGWIFRFDFDGNLAWRVRIPGGIRGTVTIPQADYVLVPSMNGVLYFLSKSNGMIKTEVKIATSQRGLWTSASVDRNENILINVKTNAEKGALLKLNGTGTVIWKFEYGKALSVPTIDSQGNIFTGTWDGKFIKMRS